jgi:hypothetical protein
MLIPAFLANGDLPPGIHRATLDEIVQRFGQSSPQRELVTQRLTLVHELAIGTGKLHRFIIFGSYVTTKLAPNDVDIILVMRDDFQESDYSREVLPMLDHQRAQRELGASVFWIRRGAILLETVDEFIASWQVTRELRKRGIVEVVIEETA